MEHTKYSISNYNYNEVYCEEKANVPFSWEYKPGLSKVTHQLSNNDTRRSNLVLQPPPCSSSRTGGDKLRVEDTHSPSILCAVQPSSLRISSFRMESQREDPFIEAYKKCTESPFMLKQSRKSQKNKGSWPNIIKHMHILSCKYFGDVMSMF